VVTLGGRRVRLGRKVGRAKKGKGDGKKEKRRIGREGKEGDEEQERGTEREECVEW